MDDTKTTINIIPRPVDGKKIDFFLFATEKYLSATCRIFLEWEIFGYRNGYNKRAIPLTN